jgi:hypothetical protein
VDGLPLLAYDCRCYFTGETAMPIARFERTAEIEAVVAALQCDGAAVVTGLAEPGLVDTLRAELRPLFDACGLDTRSDFDGSRSLRAPSSLLVAAPAAADLVDHDMVVGIANALLLPHCATYQVGSMTGIAQFQGQYTYLGFDGLRPGRLRARNR